MVYNIVLFIEICSKREIQHQLRVRRRRFLSIPNEHGHCDSQHYSNQAQCNRPLSQPSRSSQQTSPKHQVVMRRADIYELWWTPETTWGDAHRCRREQRMRSLCHDRRRALRCRSIRCSWSPRSVSPLYILQFVQHEFHTYSQTRTQSKHIHLNAKKLRASCQTSRRNPRKLHTTFFFSSSSAHDQWEVIESRCIQDSHAFTHT